MSAEDGLRTPEGRAEADASHFWSKFSISMNMLDLIKATIACGLSAFLIYSFPVVGQVVIIGLLSLLWLSYAHRTLVNLLRR